MIRTKTPRSHLEWLRLRLLYRRAFPRSERKPFALIRRMQKDGRGEILYFYDERGFLGLGTTVSGGGVVLLDYFAVAKRRRGRGNGSAMLAQLMERYAERGMFLEIEIPYDDAPNAEERRRRKSFYLRAGLTPTDTRICLVGVDMELLTYKCTMTFDEYLDFYCKNIGEFARSHIQSIE